MIRIRITRARGSTPRDAGTEMLVGPHTVTGTIGGGQMEYMAIDRARAMLARGEAEASLDIPLGPEIGQCCGGRVELTLDRLPATPPAPPTPVLIFGAGHVGRALAAALTPLPVAPRLIDSRPEELALAPAIPQTLTPLPEAELRAAPAGSAYVMVTHDHPLDFLLALEALGRGDAAYIGMVGSRSKRAAFERIARDRGVPTAALHCPLAAAAPRDKRPAVIAAFTASEIMTSILTPAPAHA